MKYKEFIITFTEFPLKHIKHIFLEGETSNLKLNETGIFREKRDFQFTF